MNGFPGGAFDRWLTTNYREEEQLEWLKQWEERCECKDLENWEECDCGALEQWCDDCQVWGYCECSRGDDKFHELHDEGRI